TPAGAVLTVVDENDAYVPMKKLNFDTTYTDVEVRADIYFEVIAEDGETEITYQLMPTAEASDAFITSEVYSVDQAAALISLVPMGTTAPSLLSNLTTPPGATITIIDKLGHERMMGDVYKDDNIVVTAADGETTKTYYLAMLEEEAFLAYVVSETFSIDQQARVISGSEVTGSTTLTDFYNNLTPAPEATMVVLNKDGVENTTGDLDEGDYLMVTAGDGVTVTYYTITLDYTGVDFEDAGINIYPNPSTGVINVAGLTQGTRIHVYNSVGVRLRDIMVHQSHEVISLNDQPAGIYFIIVKDSESVVGRYKLLLK
ncbi:MAG: T9SS type A sorting domain-containing protein, partial [bacterium]